MKGFKRKSSCVTWMASASVLALGFTSQAAFAQDAEGAEGAENAIVVTGIRASLQDAMNIKRDAQGVVDAISAEDIGKFPDTNLAESLQRITGVSIDRNSGEGSTVTVRGFGPEFNLVVLNGRQMPASGLGSCCEAPASRSFDFGNLASEGIAGVEVYKSGRATLPTGGIGSVINIKTPKPLDRPGFQGSIGVKGVVDNTFGDTEVTPEISGIISKTFADDKFGILISGSYQNRKASLAQFNAGWREGFTPNADAWSWGGLPNGDPNDWRGNNVENPPQGDDIYQTTQNAGYDFTDIERERINGQVVLQFRPTDSLSASVDYTYAQNQIDARTNSIGVWFNHNSTASSWTDGPVAGPNFYGESFGAGENKDLAITGAVAANRTVLQSLGGNLEWDAGNGLSLMLDAHRSESESKPTSPYGSNIAVGSAVYGVQDQRVNYTTDMPVISVNMYPGSEVVASNIRPAGNAFRNAYMKDTITEFALKGGYDFDTSFIESLDFGVTYTENKVRSAYGFLQTDSWGGTLAASELPDDFYNATNLPKNLSGMAGSNDQNIIPNYFTIDTEGLINFLEGEIGICSNSWVGTAQPGTCLAEFVTDRRIKEETIAPYIQSTHSFDLGGSTPANLRFGLRYEKTKTDATTLQPLPIGTAWVGDNEIAIIYSDTEKRVENLKGEYDHWLPAIDFDIQPVDDVILRASYSHTITRPDYASMQSGLELAAPIRVGGNVASVGNPNLLPYKSKNIDLSAEWYYGPASYISVGFFNKKVSNFITSEINNDSAYGLTNPALGPRVAEAQAALGGSPTTAQVRAWITANYPGIIDPQSGGILGQSNDPLVDFAISQRINSDQEAKLHGWEFAIQHSFWETGFGAILNYTVVKSDTSYDNTLRFNIPQFAVTGVSDSANAVLYYDKNGLQARVAYNWRDEFLSGKGTDPFYVESYGQIDASASYEFDNGVTVFVEGINLTNEDRRGHMRADQAIFFAAPGYARYAAGVRFSW